MSSQPPSTSEPSAKAAGMKAHLPFVVALLLGIIVGGGAGAFVVGPAMATGIAPSGAAPAPRRAPKHDEEAPADEEAGHEEAGSEEEEDEESGEAKGEKGGEKPVYTIDNLVLNPAESGGTRFLLLTVSFEAKNSAILDAMKARDAEFRDAVLVTIGAKTVDQLADMTQRETLKTELTAAAAKLFKKGAVRRIYFPQFVIQ